MKKMNINGISLALIYGMILIVLKILGLVEFSWWYVLMPFFAIFGLILLVSIMAALVEAIYDLISKK